MKAYLALLRSRPAYRTLWAGEVISITGDWFSLVAVSILAARSSETPSGLALATVLAAHMLPQAIFSPAAGWLADRFDRRSILIGGNLLEGILTVGMALAASAGTLGLLQTMLFLRSATATLRAPASGAALPSLVDKSEVATANAFGAATWSATFVVGMALGGLATELGAVAALAIDAATFGVATLVLRALPSLPPPAERRSSRAAVWRAAALDLRDAWRAAREPTLRAAVFGKTPMAVAGGVGWVALNLNAQALPFAGGAAATLGVLQALRGVGTGVGPLAANHVVGRGARAHLVAHVAAIATFAGAIGIAMADSAIAALCSVFIWGAGGGSIWVITQTEIQSRGQEGMRGRLLSLDALGFTVGMSGGALLTGVVVDSGLAVGPLAIGVGALAAASWLWVRSGLRDTAAAGPAIAAG